MKYYHGNADHILTPLLLRQYLHSKQMQTTSQHETNSFNLPTQHVVPRTRTKSAERAFSVAGPSVWNSLPTDLRPKTDTAVLKYKSLKVARFLLFLFSYFILF